LASEFEISMRIDFFRDIAATLSVEEATSGSDYVGSMLKDGVRAACVPRVGEYVLPVAAHLPHPFSLITAVEHNLAGVRLADDGETERSPSVIAVISAPWPGDGVRDEVVREFEDRDWTWREAGDLRRDES
jgi:hypothetical protein